jgi:hypothetical protein
MLLMENQKADGQYRSDPGKTYRSPSEPISDSQQDLPFALSLFQIRCKTRRSP